MPVAHSSVHRPWQRERTVTHVRISSMLAAVSWQFSGRRRTTPRPSSADKYGAYFTQGTEIMKAAKLLASLAFVAMASTSVALVGVATPASAGADRTAKGSFLQTNLAS